MWGEIMTVLVGIIGIAFVLIILRIAYSIQRISVYTANMCVAIHRLENQIRESGEQHPYKINENGCSLPMSLVPEPRSLQNGQKMNVA